MCLPGHETKSEPVIPTRLKRDLSQARRIRSLTKQAHDALTLIAGERLNLDTASRDAVNQARQALSKFESIVEQQPIQE